MGALEILFIIIIKDGNKKGANLTDHKIKMVCGTVAMLTHTHTHTHTYKINTHLFIYL